MLDSIRAAWRNAMTEGDNATHCPVRLGAFGTGVVYHAAAAWMVLGQHTHIDMAVLGQYVQHMGLLVAATAGGVGAKALLHADAPREAA